MNCRLLGKCIGDQYDILPLRPIDLMTGFLETMNLLDLKNTTSPTDKSRRGIAYTRRLVEEWRQKWINQYSFSLQKRQK